MAYNIPALLDKQKKGQKLTADEQKFLDAASNYQPGKMEPAPLKELTKEDVKKMEDAKAKAEADLASKKSAAEALLKSGTREGAVKGAALLNSTKRSTSELNALKAEFADSQAAMDIINNGGSIADAEAARLAEQKPAPAPEPAPAPQLVQPVQEQAPQPVQQQAPAPQEPVVPDAVQMEQDREIGRQGMQTAKEDERDGLIATAAALNDKDNEQGGLDKKDKKSFKEIISKLAKDWGVPLLEVIQAGAYGYTGNTAKKLYEIRQEKEEREKEREFATNLDKYQREYEERKAELDRKWRTDEAEKERIFQAQQAEYNKINQKELLGMQLSADEALEKVKLAQQMAAKRAGGTIPASVSDYVSGGAK